MNDEITPHIFITGITAIKPGLIRVNVQLEIDKLVQYELTLTTSDFITIEGENHSLNLDKFKQLITDESFRILETGYIASILSDQLLDWPVIMKQVQESEDNAMKLAYGESKE